MASNKLRKRLEEADDQTLSKMTENFCMIGTPLPRLDAKRDVNEYKPVWQQEVLDEQGRKRFHGAFTGGYSAGYYNTVGSKEGWAPSSFRSSRKDKEKKGGIESSTSVGTRPEDFMDEEDLEALREGRGAMSSTQTYGMEQPQQRERDPLMDMLGLGRDPLASLKDSNASSSIQIAPSSLGTRLLQRMGWRQGQGLGPRVSFQRRKELLAQMGRPIDDEMEDDEAKKHIWPPPDTSMPTFSTKNDAKGLGWTDDNRAMDLNEALRRARGGVERNPEEQKKKSGGFGVGALEDNSDGEEEVYSSGNRIEESTLARLSSNRWSRDEDRMVIGGNPSGNTKNEKEKEKFVNTPAVLSDNTWHDGRAMIVGFRIALRTNEKEPWFETPQVPKGWKPDPQQVWSQNNTASDKSVKRKEASQLNASDRATILGEARLPGPPPSIQDYLSQKDKERLQRGKEAAAQIKGEKVAQPDVLKNTTENIPFLDAAVAKAALQGYKPFVSEPEKQARYQLYLTSQVDSNEKSLSALRPGNHQSQSQFIAELRDFAKSASIFKPMSTVMASRFQSSVSGSNDLPQINPGLHIPEQKPKLNEEAKKLMEAEEQKKEEEKREREEMINLTHFQRNARLGDFGRNKTRETKEWRPARLLCKRFNVPMPFSEEGEAEEEDGTTREKGGAKNDQEEEMEAAFGASKVRRMDIPKVNAKWEVSKRQLQQLAAQRSWESEGSHQRGSDNEPNSNEQKVEEEGQGKRASGIKGEIDVNNIGLGEADDKGEEETAFVKPAMDVFKAVFADDDDDDDGEDEDEDEGKKEKEKDVITPVLDSKRGEDEKEVLAGKPEESSIAPTSIDDFKPTFVPRKRRAEEGNSKKESGEKKKKKEKNRPKGLLTFSVDDDEEVESTPAKTSTKPNRMRAADLFN